MISLSPRELEVITWAARGKTYWETAVILGIAYGSVKTYLDMAKAKLDAANVTHAVAKAYELGILS